MTMRLEPPFLSSPPADFDDVLEWLGAERTKASLFYRDVQERVEALPGVQSVAAVNRMPLSGNWWGSSFRIEGREANTPSGEFASFSRPVLPGYFQTMEIPLVRGRALTMQDESGALPVALISQTAARRYWPDQDPIGRQLIYGAFPPFTIVGIVGDVKHNRLEFAPEPIVYMPLAQAVEGFSGDFGMDLVIRSETEPATLVGPIRETVQSLNPNLPVFNVSSMNEVLARSIADRRFYMILLTLMGALTLVLSAIGTYSVISYSTSQRMRELGIRVALGAGRGEILKLVVGRGVGLTLAGVAAGLLGAFALTRVLGGVLFGVTPTDPSTFVTIAAGLILVALASCYLPARRAARVDPGVVLREE
jgi:putative ABC transport system permease protein